MENLYKTLLESYMEGKFEQKLQSLEKLPPVTPIVGASYIPYPSLEDPAFYEKLTAKKEFIDPNTESADAAPYESYEKESLIRCSETAFKLSPHQIFVKRFLSPVTPYNGILLYHSVGVGKTCSAISIAEQHIGLYNKKVLVVLSSNLKDNFKKQIFDLTRYDIEKNIANLCTGTKYPDMVIDRKNIPLDIFEKRINKLINERYQFIGYKELVNLMEKIKKRIEKSSMDPARHKQRYEEKIREYFSDRLIIIDEAHNLRMPSENGKKKISSAFNELFQIVVNTKLLLMTATPVFNDPREIIWLINLLLTNDKRPSISISNVFDKSGAVTKKGAVILGNAVKGYVSFMRGENPFSFPFRVYPKQTGDKNMIKTMPSFDMKGNVIPESNRIKTLQLIGSELSPKQIMIYEQLQPKLQEEDFDDSDDDEGEVDEKISNDMQNMLQLCNIVYPSENPSRTFGEKGFNECFLKSKVTKKIKYEYRTKEQFLSQCYIKQYAPKLARVVDYVKKAEGIVFIYSQYYYSGIIPIALALEHIGFNKLGGNIGENFSIDQQVPLINGKRPNYVILSRNKDLSPNNDKEIAIAKSTENSDGQVIKVVIVSKIGTEGIDFKRIREMHLIDPWYNMNRAEQIIGRGIRTCSHIDLPKEKRNVSIFLHAVTMPENEEESIDLRVYRIAENKQKNIQVVENILKSSAVDCSFNKPNLYFPVDKVNMSFDIVTSQGKIIKGYKVGDVDKKGLGLSKCATNTENVSIDTSTYNIRLLDDEIDIYKVYIASLFNGVRKSSFNEISTMLRKTYKSIDDDILKYSLDQMVENKHMFNGYNGKKGYLVYAGNKYVFMTDSIASNIMHKARLPLDAIPGARIVPTDKPKPVEESKVSQPSPPSSKELLSVANHIQSMVDAFKKHINAKYEKEMIDAAVDRLSSEELSKLCLFLNSDKPHPLRSQILQSVSQAPFYVKNESGKIQVYYNHIDQEYYCAPLFEKCTALDLAKFTKQIKALKTTMYNKHTENVNGFVQHKNGAARFKIRDGNTAGYVCFQTQSLQVNELKNRILAIDDSALMIDKVTKVKLCEAYEMLLRRDGKVIRPFLRSSDK